jgi:hypothetical protein
VTTGRAARTRADDGKEDMNVLSPPPVANNGHAGGDGLDNLLRAFFQAEMPSSWPDAPVPPASERPALLTLHAPAAAPRLRVLTRSRLALAASVALMIGGSWILSLSSVPHPEAGSASVHTTGAAATRHNHNLVDPDAAPQYRVQQEQHIITPDGPPQIKFIVDDPK